MKKIITLVLLVMTTIAMPISIADAATKKRARKPAVSTALVHTPGVVQEINDATVLPFKTKSITILFYCPGDELSEKYLQVYEQMAKKYGDKVMVTKADLEKCPRLRQKYEAQDCPRLLAFYSGSTTPSWDFDVDPGADLESSMDYFFAVTAGMAE